MASVLISARNVSGMLNAPAATKNPRPSSTGRMAYPCCKDKSSGLSFPCKRNRTNFNVPLAVLADLVEECGQRSARVFRYDVLHYAINVVTVGSHVEEVGDLTGWYVAAVYDMYTGTGRMGGIPGRWLGYKTKLKSNKPFKGPSDKNGQLVGCETKPAPTRVVLRSRWVRELAIEYLSGHVEAPQLL